MAPTSEWLFVPRLPRRSHETVPIWILRTWELITPSLDLRLRWGLKQTCSSPQELSNGVLHFTYAHRGWVDSWLLVVGSQIANLTPSPTFDHNLCSKCPNGSYKAIFDIYTSRPFQWYKDYFNERCFKPYNQALSLRESRRTPCRAPKFLVDPLEGPSLRLCGRSWNLEHDLDFQH
jgi:hypothetical protein